MRAAPYRRRRGCAQGAAPVRFPGCHPCDSDWRTITITFVAYIGDEWPPSQITRMTAIYVSGSVIGGFGGSVGAFAPSLVWDRGGWPAVTAMMAVMLFAVGLVIWLAWDRQRAASA